MIVATPRGRWTLGPPAPGKRGVDSPSKAVTAGRADGVAGGGSGVAVERGLSGFDVGGGLVGSGVAGPSGVLVGTVCRAGLCPGAAHRSGLRVMAAISTPTRIAHSPYLLLLIAVS
jgi:hypothetical protein